MYSTKAAENMVEMQCCLLHLMTVLHKTVSLIGPTTFLLHFFKPVIIFIPAYISISLQWRHLFVPVIPGARLVLVVAPYRVSQGKVVLGEEPYKELFTKPN